MANTISVSSSEELYATLATVSGGETILLDPGHYGDIALWWGVGFDVQFDSMVTIKSADLDNPAVFSKVALSKAANLTFDSVVMDYQFSEGDPTYVKPFEIKGSSNISIVNSLFNGDLANGISDKYDGFGYGIGLSVRDSSGIVLENNEFKDWYRAGVFGSTNDIVVSNNEVHSVSSDGFDFAAVSGVLIEGNYFHDFEKSDLSSAHMDMIQFWTSGTTSPNKDIIIRGNTLDIGSGDSTQSIFMRNEMVDSYGAGQEMYYKNVLIENNTIYNGQLHGITIGETDGLTIANNLLVEAEGGKPLVDGNSSIPAINIKSDSMSVQVVNNGVFSIAGYTDQADWTVKNNAFIQNNDPDLPGYYGKVFISSTLEPVSGQHHYVAAPGEMLDVLNAGSQQTRFIDLPSDLEAMFNVKSHVDAGLVFDASLTRSPIGAAVLEEAEFSWDLGDGSTAQGALVSHSFAQPGFYDVNLTVSLPDGSTTTEALKVGVAGDELVSFDRETGIFYSHAYGVSTDSEADINSLVHHSAGSALSMSGTGVQATVDHEALSRLFGADNFALSLSLTATNGSNSAGELFRMHGHLLSKIDSSGRLSFVMGADDGSKVKIFTSGVNFNDGLTHDLQVVFDGKANAVEIWVDGAVNATGQLTGSVGEKARDLTFGDPWGGEAFKGEITSFSLSSTRYDYDLFQGEEGQLSNSQLDGAEPATEGVEPEAVAPEVVEPRDPLPEKDDGALLPEKDDGALLPEKDAGALPLLRGGYQLDFAAVQDGKEVKLYDDAKIIEVQGGKALSFDGNKDFAALGRLKDFEESQKLAFSVDFTSRDHSGSGERLVWNHLKVGLTLEGDGIRVHAGKSEGHFSAGFKVDGLGLNDGKEHTAVVMVDAQEDRLQVVVDDVVVLDDDTTDLDFVGAGGHEWGWSLGAGFKRWFEGDVHDFQVSDDFSFVDPSQDDLALLG